MRTVSAVLVALLVVFGDEREFDRGCVDVVGRRAEDVLAALTVKGRGPKTGYTREKFGAAWADVDQNGCDTRDDIFNRDLMAKEWRPGTHGCVVVTGVVHDPYTGRRLVFDKADAAAVQIDHVVALSDAWQKGAARGRTDDESSPTTRSTCWQSTVRPTAEERRRHRHLAAAAAVVPVPLRRPTGRGEGEVEAVGDSGGAGRDAQRAGACPEQRVPS